MNLFYQIIVINVKKKIKKKINKKKQEGRKAVFYLTTH